jgi:hypothetical protein
MQIFERILSKFPLLLFFYKNDRKNRPFLTKTDGFLLFDKFLNLFLFKTVTASAAFRIAVTRIAYVNFTKRTVIARTIVLTFGYATADGRVDFLISFIHHFQKPPFYL